MTFNGSCIKKSKKTSQIASFFFYFFSNCFFIHFVSAT